jgi:hypothetical protein
LLETSNQPMELSPQAPLRVLVIYFSQAGDAARVAQTLAEPLAAAGHRIDYECLEPAQPYPFPWRNPVRFFDVLPECLLGPPPALRAVSFDPRTDYDWVILVYQVWFLSPSLPIQGFLGSPAASVLHGRNVVTASVSRNMWQSASERMKRDLRRLSAHQTDNIVVTHQGPPWVTFITTPRALLFGRTEPFWGIFPQAGIGTAEIDRVRRLGELLRDCWPQRARDDHSPALSGAGAVVNRRYMIPEAIGWYLFMAWAHVLKALGHGGRWLRWIGICVFMLFLAVIVVVGIPLVVLLTLMLTPLLRQPMKNYAERLAAPSG